MIFAVLDRRLIQQ